MAYVPGFKHDIFISYAHKDNEPDAQKVQWVSEFRTNLKNALNERLGKDLEIFFDTKDLYAHHELDYIVENVRQSAIFLSVFTPSYVAREWTLRELTAFEQAASGRQRIVAIEVLPVDERDYPPQIHNLKRTLFYFEDKESGIPLKLTPASDSDLYSHRIQILAHQLVKLLRELRDQYAARPPETVKGAEAGQASGTPSPPPPAAAKSGKTVLLAQVTMDLYDAREQVLAFLEQYNFKVLPEGDYLQGGAEFARDFGADLAKAELFVQLLGPFPSLRPKDLKAEGDTEPKSYAQFQYDAAVKRGIPILQWRLPDIDPSKITHWDKALLDGPNVRAMGLQEFLKEIKKETERQPAKEGNGKLRQADVPRIFINADREDLDFARELMGEFVRNSCRVALPATADAEEGQEIAAKEVMQDLEENIELADALVFLYGRAPQRWVRGQLNLYNKIEKSKGLERSSPRMIAVYIAPPEAKPDLDMAWPDLRRIDCRQNFTVDPVQKIVAELRGG